MTKAKNRRIGQGMKARVAEFQNAEPAVPLSADAGQPEALKEAPEQQKEVSETAQNGIHNGGTLEGATVQNLDLAAPAADVAVAEPDEARKNLEELMRGSVDARSKGGGEPAEDPPKPTIAEIEALMQQTGNQVRIDPDGTVKAFPIGERKDGTFGLVVTVPEGMIESIRQQADAEKQAPEEWVSERFAEWLEQWWSPPKGR